MDIDCVWEVVLEVLLSVRASGCDCSHAAGGDALMSALYAEVGACVE